ncbi:predicted protein [Methanosarcina acetivorans C2A]|uniref:Uncharacterized protein n=1 Tax=Methanosarcina acetivorans (strain ATCC 35395 / DSM 2834 / JCM 12185 / C2A) TaxID=188937 RepID=Q8TKN7_METAC|nr:predicted protein [Methanosarcina acetivorans C2A]
MLTGVTSTSVSADAGTGKVAEKISSTASKARIENGLKFRVPGIIVNYFIHIRYKEFALKSFSQRMCFLEKFCYRFAFFSIL